MRLILNLTGRRPASGPAEGRLDILPAEGRLDILPAEGRSKSSSAEYFIYIFYGKFPNRLNLFKWFGKFFVPNRTVTANSSSYDRNSNIFKLNEELKKFIDVFIFFHYIIYFCSIFQFNKRFSKYSPG